MHNITFQIIQKSRSWRTKHLEPLAQFLLKCHITADLMTSLSFLFGLSAVYFLFQKHTLFLIFMLLHLLADAFDGVLARLSAPSKYGSYLDYGTDQTIALLTLLKIGYYLQDYFVFLIAGLFIISQVIYLFSKFRYPIFFFRTASLLFLVIPWKPFVVIAYLYAGVMSLYSLVRQLSYILERKH